MTTALAESPQTQAIQWSSDEVTTIRNTVAKGASDNELKMFLHLSQTYGLDPFAKEIWFIKAGGQPVIMTGRDGYLKIANNRKEYEGIVSDVVYEGDSFQRTVDGVSHTYSASKRGGILGAYALVYRQGIRFPAYVFAPFRDYNKGNNVWRQYPHAMILKVAESMALKRAFSLSGLVTREEWDAGECNPQVPPRPIETIEAEVVENTPASPSRTAQGEAAPQEKGNPTPTLAERKKALYDAYLAVCDGVPQHAQNAMLKITEGRPSKEWTETDLKRLAVDLYRRQGKMKDSAPVQPPVEPPEPEGAAEEYIAELEKEGPVLPFGEALRDVMPDIDRL